MSLVDRVTLDRISTEARDIHFARTALTLLATVLWCVGWFGWFAAKTLGAVWLAIWLAVCWSATAVKVGWVEARADRGGT